MPAATKQSERVLILGGGGGGPPASYDILLENGSDKLLLESGSFILLESAP